MLNYGMGITISAFDQVSHVIRSIEGVIKGLERTSGKSFGLTNQSLGKIAGGVAIAGAGMAGIGSTWNLAKQAAEVEKGLAAVHVLTHATKEEMAKLEHFAMRTGTAMGVMPMEAIAAMEILGTQNVKVERMMKMLPTIFRFTKANNGLTSEAATSILTQANTLFALPQEYFEVAADQIQKTLDIFKLKAQDMELLLARGSSGFTLTDAYLSDFLAIAGTIKDLMPSPMMAGTGASYMVKELSDRKNRAQIKDRLGVDILDGMGGFRKMPDVLKELYVQVEKMSKVEMTDFFGTVFNETGLNAIVNYFARLKAGFEDDNKVLHKGLKGIEFTFGEIEGAMGNLKQNYEELMNTFDGQIEIATARWKAFKEELGKPMAKAWRPFVEAWGQVLNHIQIAFEGLDPAVQNAIGQLAVWGSLLATVVGLSGTLIALWPLLTPIFASIGAGIAAFVTAALPWLLVLGAIALTIKMIELNVGGAGDAWKEATKGMSDAWGGVLSTLSYWFDEVWTGIKEGFEVAKQTMDLDWFRDAVKHLGESVKAFFLLFDSNAESGKVLRTIGRAIGWVVGIVVGAIVKFTAVLVEMVSIVMRILGVIGKGIGIFTNAIPGTVNAVKRFFGVKTGVKTPEPPPENKIEELWGTSEPNASEDKNMSPPPPEAPTLTSSAKNFVPLSRMTVPVGENASGYYEGVMPAGSETKDPINYEKLAEACSKQQLYCVFDGDKIVGYIDRKRKANEALGSM